ncbi:MAG: hypothetical protein DME22_18600 [Verrucomicrobia bacterium]|nr:MAG: hypothetical protein DME22_18600 [Verrucomicrobiota bacterium]PYJ98617.1 MAG: hypothetical protein DME23_11585 [Verrucomicrobiota bacterium]
MKTTNASRVRVWFAVALTGFILGYFAFDNSSKVRELRSRLTQAESELGAFQHTRSRAPARRIGSAILQRTLPGSPAGDTNAAPTQITDEDIQVALEMNERAKQGEYILQFERPTDRKFTDSAINDMVSRMASNNAPELRSTFAQLGITPEKSVQLETHYQKIMLASLDAEMAIQQVLTARHDYDKRVRALLSDEHYATYRQYEESKPASREYAILEEYSREKSIPIDPEYQQRVIALMQQAQAYTETSWHGAYEGLPEPAVGDEAVINQLEQQISQIKEAVNLLKQKAAEVGFPEEYLNLLDAYYRERAQIKQNTIDTIKNRLAPVASGK